MARKFDLISKLYEDTIKEVQSPDKWRSFLRTACYNYRLRFDEQLLVYAQKPEATAVLPIERWNKNFGRWVNRGAKGIAVFETLNRDTQRLVHYFDISDTHESERSRPVPVWSMKSEYADEIISTLESTFGDLKKKETLEEAIISASANAVDDNLADYEQDLMNSVNDTLLEDLDEDNIKAMYRDLVSNSVAYLIMSRLGINTEAYYDDDDFKDIVNFNSKEILDNIGVLTGAVSEIGLSAISKTVFALDRQNRIIEKSKTTEYTDDTKNERSFENGRDNLHDAGRLSDTESGTSGTAEGGTRNIRSDEEGLPVSSQESSIHELPHSRDTDDTSLGSRTGSSGNGGTSDKTDGTESRSDGGSEIEGSDDMGGIDEQHQTFGEGNSTLGSDLRLDVFDEEAGRRDHPFFGVDEVVNQIFATTPHLKVSLEEIGIYFEKETDKDKRIEYIKSIFNNDFTEVILPDDMRVGYKTYDNGLLIWKGNYMTREGQRFLRWNMVSGHFEAMRMLDMLHSQSAPLPSIESQSELISETAGRKTPAFSFPQEIIDAVLTRGSGVSEGKMRIYEQFLKSLSKKENIDFLKNEYGIGGSSSAVSYTGVGEDHDAKGISLHIGYKENAPQQILKWNDVEKRIGELIKLDRYLNPKEKEHYPVWLEKQEALRAEAAAEREIREAIYNPPTGRTDLTAAEYEYRYSLGDKVYIGATEYELLSFNDDNVMLFDKAFPLFNKEMPRDEFDARVKENPLNDHLRVVVNSEKGTETGEHDYSKYTPVMQDYFKLKDENPNTVILYQIGAFMEAMGNDAAIVSEELGLHITDRTISPGERIEMCGFPVSRLEVNINMLHDRGYDIGISGLDDSDERKFYLMNSDRKDEPVQSVPVGRIEYLDGNGNVENIIEYTDARMLERDIKGDNRSGIRMAVRLYKDNDGNTMDHNFIDDLPNPLESFEIIDRPIPQSEYDILLGRAQDLIEKYVQEDLGMSFFRLPSDLSDISLAYTTTEDENHNITAVLDLVNFRIETKIDNTTVRTEQYDSLQDIVENALPGLTFDELVGVSDEELAPFLDDTELNSVTIDLTPSEENGENSDLIGRHITLDDRDFVIEKVNMYGDVSMRDISFENATGFPIVRVEKVEFVRDALQQQEEVIPVWERQPKEDTKTFDLHPDIPMADRNTFDLRSFELEEVGKKARFNRNIEAIRVLKQCETENRFATPEEQNILAQYVGWGGIPEAFDENNNAWRNEYTELSDLLTKEEYQSARASTLTAFYTPPAVISSIYKVMDQMGFKEGNILEPSCGIGNFIGMLPQSMENSRVYGVEIDKISAGIAQQLYQKTSIAAQPFENAEIPDSFFDAVVGNVPFGDFGVADKRYDKNHFLIHDYFFAKSLDKLRPGGVMALVTSKGTMDKENPSVRKYIAQRADLLGAVRLPNNTFKGNAGTEVVSDILILQKRDRIIDIEPEWVHLNTDENGIKMNEYFVEHPEMILGDMQIVSGRFGDETTCVPYENADLETLLDEAVSNIHGEINEYEQDEELLENDDSIPADISVANFSFTPVGDEIYYREDSRMTPVSVTATAENRIKGLMKLRDSVRRLLELESEDYPEADIKAEMKNLNTLYDEFTEKYGLINSRANRSAFSNDSSYYLLSSLEKLDEDGNLERKEDIFYKRTVRAHKPVTTVDTSVEALAVSMGEKAEVDMEYMCELTGKTEQEICDELKDVIFLNPEYKLMDKLPKYLTANEYLSGNIREKLELAKEASFRYPDEFTSNVNALEKVMPEPLGASEISVRLGATWIPIEYVQSFMYDFLSTPRYAQWKIKIHYSPYTSEWSIENKKYDSTNIKAYRTYGTDRINAYKIIEETLNLKDVRIFDQIEDEEGKRKYVLNKKETTIALQKQELIKEAFKEWIWKDPDRREHLCKIYNEKFNSIRPREYDGSHITFNGMNPEIKLMDHQKNAVAHIIYGGNTLLAHTVGAGKTFEMAAAAMESKRLGLCSKSLFVVPNHLTEQWASEFLQLYPGANILVATKKDFTTANRKRFCGRIATGDYDAIIIGHSQFERIPISVERQRRLLEQQVNEISDGIVELKKNRGDNFSIKQLEKLRRNVSLKLQKLNDQSRKDDVVTFEELGVDRLFIDESHNYKNLYLYTKMRNVGGIAQTEAQKSSDLFMKCRYLDEITNGRGTIFATGTPISNSMVELYTIQRYLQYETLVENGLQHFDAWASTFGETVTAYELKPEGTGYRTKTRFAKFYNLPELMAMFKEVADIKTADTLNLPTPEPHYHNIAVKPSKIQKDLVAELSERAERVRNGMVNPSEDNMLKITNDGRKLALDQRIENPFLPDHEDSKVNACVQIVHSIWEKTADKRSSQLIFCDLSTPKPDADFSVYTDIREKLIKLGIPEKEISFIHDANSESQKQELFKKVRRGDVRVLIGSTQKMGAGTNVQDKLIALHDLDCPWRPSDLEQRSGRIVRQGNENSDVEIYRYVTEETFDAYLYQLVEGKQKFAAQIMTSKSPVRSAEDIDDTALSYAEIKMLATGNPFIKEKMDLDIQVQKLKLFKANYLTEKYDLEDKILRFYPHEIALLTERVEGLKADLETALSHPKGKDDKFTGMVINKCNYTDKKEAGQMIIEACKSKTSSEPTPLGEYRGFRMELEFDTFERNYVVLLKGNFTHRVSLGTDVQGNIVRIDNGIDNIQLRLSKAEEQLKNTKDQLETAKIEVEKPFVQEDELKLKLARLTELNAQLDMDDGDVPVIGTDSDERDDPPNKNRNDRDER